ncbi:hypothetical protein CR203_16430 [Salipaludibacillus neizhouensis]|uniref:Uncharacterized protein n=1 Tax=Salipaludibacillus neizhouensis TaxID=885475 RepID=A0A3A9JZ17_9BACI|nr:hypothetical protein [Salipaludibacillus neizhouensis]RKL66144.1 hypothetical protein CR203_16430 [Salipaludibacillus neizhouensis]
MPVLPPSFIGKKVYVDGGQRYFILKYQEPSGTRKFHALLFDHETPVIFAVLDYQGKFLDSFYLSNKTTVESDEASEKYKQISDRKKQLKMTQDDLKDALKSNENAKKKNIKIKKQLVDEHLEDIKNGWSSRLIALQIAEGISDQSLIMVTLDSAIDKANGMKAFHHLLNHRIDQLIPNLAKHVKDSPELIEEVPAYYLSYDQAKIVEQFLNDSTKYVDIENYKAIESILQQAQKIDHVHYSTVLRSVLVKLFKRVKAETEDTKKDWLNKTVHDQSLRTMIVQLLKKQTS